MMINFNLNKNVFAIAIVISFVFANYTLAFSQNTPKPKENAKKKTVQEKSEDTDDNMHYNLGVIAAETKNFKEALNEFSIAIAINPKNAFALYGKGSVYYQMKELDSAIEYMNKTLAIKPNDELALGLRAASLQQLEKYNRAISDYKNLIKIDANNSHYYLNLAYCYQVTNDTTQAIKNYQLAESKGDHSNELYFNLANLFASKKEYKTSLGFVDKILAKDADFSDIYDLQLYNIMKVYNCDSAIRRYSAISERIEHKARNLFEIGICKIEEKDFGTAIELFSEAYKIDNTELLCLYYRGFAYARLDSIDKSIVDLQEFLNISQSQNTYPEFQESAQKQLDIFIERKKREK